jgi:TRAP-type uncharacterized transport system fused permease subunit
VVGWSTFVLPFLFVLTPSLLMDGSAGEIVLNFARVLFGLFIGTAAVVGFAFTPLGGWQRSLYGALSLAVVMPPELFAQALWVNATGVLLAIALLAFDFLRQRGRKLTLAGG